MNPSTVPEVVATSGGITMLSFCVCQPSSFAKFIKNDIPCDCACQTIPLFHETPSALISLKPIGLFAAAVDFNPCAASNVD